MAELWTHWAVQGPEFKMFAALVDGEIVGFAGSGPARDKDAPAFRELYFIYLLDAWHGTGIGQKLFDAVGREGRAALPLGRRRQPPRAPLLRPQRLHARRRRTHRAVPRRDAHRGPVRPLTSPDVLQAWALEGIPEITPGTDLVAVIADAAAGTLEDGDILVVTSKIVSKAEGRILAADDREDAITAETVRLVASRVTPSGSDDPHRAEPPRHRVGGGGVDASNTPEGTILLLPRRPRRLCPRSRYGAAAAARRARSG